MSAPMPGKPDWLPEGIEPDPTARLRLRILALDTCSSEFDVARWLAGIRLSGLVSRVLEATCGGDR